MNSAPKSADREGILRYVCVLRTLVKDDKSGLRQQEKIYETVNCNPETVMVYFNKSFMLGERLYATNAMMICNDRENRGKRGFL